MVMLLLLLLLLLLLTRKIRDPIRCLYPASLTLLTLLLNEDLSTLKALLLLLIEKFKT